MVPVADRLERYREMRDFSLTPEPSGAKKRKARRARPRRHPRALYRADSAKRLAELTLDPWAEYTSTRQSITEAMWRALAT
jgi:hypothetical protein